MKRAVREKDSCQTEDGLPFGFRDRLSEQFTAETLALLETTFTQRFPVVRINTLRSSVGEIKGRLLGEGIELCELPFCDYAFAILNRPMAEIVRHELCVRGEIYPQSFASLLVPCALDPKPGEQVLDLCAAPGSKTSQIAMLMERQGSLIANEPARTRFFKLKANLERLGVFSKQGEFVSLLRTDGARLFSRYRNSFDRILVDAPCSAEARFIRGDTQSFGVWSSRQVKKCASLQKKLLGTAFQMVRPGGVVLYSTCTLSLEENEEVADWALRKFGDLVTLEPLSMPGVQRCHSDGVSAEEILPAVKQGTFRIAPDRFAESFFLAKFRRKGGATF
jgi:NOL1/NOP2/sun family putative RNA methylase